MVTPIKNPAVAGLCLLLVGCASATPYQPKGDSGGYTDFQTQPGVHFVSFGANLKTTREETMKYWHRRAGEICPEGYEVLEQKTGTGDVVAVPIYGMIATRQKPRVEGYIRCATQSAER